MMTIIMKLTMNPLTVFGVNAIMIKTVIKPTMKTLMVT